MKEQLWQFDVLLGRRSENGRCAVPFSGHNSGVRCGRVLAGCQQRQQRQRQLLRGTMALYSPGRTQLDGKARRQRCCGHDSWEPWRGGRPTLQHRLYAPAQRVAGEDSPTCAATPYGCRCDPFPGVHMAAHCNGQPCTHFRPAQFLVPETGRTCPELACTLFAAAARCHGPSTQQLSWSQHKARARPWPRDGTWWHSGVGPLGLCAVLKAPQGHRRPPIIKGA